MSNLSVPIKKRVYWGAESLVESNNGIGRLARLVAKVLSVRSQQGTCFAEADVLSDKQSVTNIELPVRASAGSRARFAATSIERHCPTTISFIILWGWLVPIAASPYSGGPLWHLFAGSRFGKIACPSASGGHISQIV